MRQTMNYRKFAWILGTVLVLFLILFVIASRNLAERREQEAGLRNTLSRLEERNKLMDAELRQVGTEEYVVSSAMNNFAFMNKNDLRFQFENPEALYAYTEQELEILMEETAE